MDTCEEEKVYADRIRDQGAFFGVPPERVLELGHEAKAFTQTLLARPFTVLTRWHKALGRSKQDRYYCTILTADGKDLAQELIAHGLARIYGTKTELWDGRTSKDYNDTLQTLQTTAQQTKLGGWR